MSHHFEDLKREHTYRLKKDSDVFGEPKYLDDHSQAFLLDYNLVFCDEVVREKERIMFRVQGLGFDELTPTQQEVFSAQKHNPGGCLFVYPLRHQIERVYDKPHEHLQEQILQKL